MKKFYAFFIVAMAMICSFQLQAQTAYVSLDTIPNGGTIKFCQSDYSQVVIYKPDTAATNIQWLISVPANQWFYTDSVILNSSNSSTIVNNAFISTETGTFNFYFVFVPGPTSPNLVDANVCGDAFSTTFNAQNTGIAASYLWSTGETTKNITVNHEGQYSVIIDNGCGVAYDTALVISNHTNDADLGPDLVICLNDTITLTTGNTNITTYAWSTSAATSTIDVWQSGAYAVTTTDNASCVSTDTVHVTVLAPYDQQELCMANFDTITQYNILSWEQHLSVGIDSIDIQKETSLNVWESIAVVPNTSTTFVDSGSNPQTNSDSYRILVVDSCSNRSAPSDPHTTISLLTSYNPGPNIMGFNWSHYLVNGALVAPNYTVYGIDTAGGIHTIGTVTGSQNYYNWNTPDLTYVKFFVGFQLTCGSKTNYLVRSNYTGNPVTGIAESSLSDLITVFPTLTDGPITITTDLAISNISVYNSLGQVLLVTDQKQFVIPYQGLCILCITTPQGMMTQKIMAR